MVSGHCTLLTVTLRVTGNRLRHAQAVNRFVGQKMFEGCERRPEATAARVQRSKFVPGRQPGEKLLGQISNFLQKGPLAGEYIRRHLPDIESAAPFGITQRRASTGAKRNHL